MLSFVVLDTKHNISGLWTVGRTKQDPFSLFSSVICRLTDSENNRYLDLALFLKLWSRVV